jgi:hypothetical protein
MRINVFLAIIFISLICLFFVGSATCDETLIFISPSSSTLPKSAIGTNFQINISISDVTNLWSWKVSLNWNPNVLNFTNADEGPFLKSEGSTLFLNAPTQSSGYLQELSDTLLENVSASGNGTLVTVTFEVLASGQSDIKMNGTELLQPSPEFSLSPITHKVDNGQLTVLGSEGGESAFPIWTIPTITIVAIIISAAILIKKRLKPNRQHHRKAR